MENKVQPSLTNRQYMMISACSLNKEDVRKLLDILQEWNNKAEEYELKRLENVINDSDNPEEYFKQLKEGFQLHLTATATDHQQIYGTIEEVFSSTNFPEQILTVYAHSKIILEVRYNYIIHNSFELMLDFCKQPIFNVSIKASDPTPNNSHFEAAGYDSTWVNGIFHEVGNFFKKKSKSLSWLHQSYVYDLMLLVLGIPICFWACFKLSTLVDKFATFSIFVKSALYVYVFFVVINLLHFAFRYGRWIWPLVEYQTVDNKSFKHRKILGAIILGLIGTIIWDIIKTL
jgi:hypothetical protein